MSADLLERMALGSRARCDAAELHEPLPALRERAGRLPAPPPLHLHADGFDVIAEVKLRSPSAGELTDGSLDPVAQATAYAGAGAAAVSVLTEPLEFHGDLRHLQRVAEALRPLGVPAMRKDFLVAPYQVWEARAAGAGGVLLIVAMLEDRGVVDMVHAAAEAGLFVLLEAFDEADLDRIARLLPRLLEADVLVGLNSRNLRTLDVEVGRFAQLRERFPAGLPSVAESGLGSAEDIAGVAALGYDLALVGSALMTGGDPAKLLAAMLAAGRAAR